MPQIYDMGPTALLPLRRKACWGYFYTMYRHKKIAQSLNIQSEFTPLHTSSSFLAVAQYSMEDFIGVWASSSDKTVWEHPTHPVTVCHHSCPSSLCALQYSMHWSRQQSPNHHSSSPSSLRSIYCSLLQAKTMTCTCDMQRSQSSRQQLFLHFTSQQLSLYLSPTSLFFPSPLLNLPQSENTCISKTAFLDHAHNSSASQQ